MAQPTLRTVTRTQGNNEALKTGAVAPHGFSFEFEEVPVLVKAFRRMVRGLEFDVSEMADQAEQRHRRGRHRPLRELLGVEVGALHLQRDPVGAQVLVQRVALGGQRHTGVARIPLAVACQPCAGLSVSRKAVWAAA